jgi:SHS2 domain-containing protein
VAVEVASSHTFDEHTGEVRLHLRARSLSALFAEAAQALAELMLERPSDDGVPACMQRVVVHARDREALLAAWIDELIFLSETRKLVWMDARVDRMTDTDLDAAVRGVVPAALRTQVKAATLHDLRIREGTAGSLEATLVLDV